MDNSKRHIPGLIFWGYSLLLTPKIPTGIRVISASTSPKISNPIMQLYYCPPT